MLSDMKRGTIALLCIAISACAPKLYQTSPSGGMIGLTGATNKNTKAAKIATDECAKVGKDARVTRVDIWSNTASYECVPK